MNQDDMMIREAIIRHRTQFNSFQDFPIGTQIQVITPISEHWNFYQELGYVVHNDGTMITVKFNKIKNDINIIWAFKPSDLKVVYKPSWFDRILNKILRRK